MLAWLAGGCAPPAAPEPPPGLAYRVPEPPVAAYRMADTVRVEIQALGQAFTVEGGALSEWRMDYAPDSAGVRVTATLLDLDATMSNPLGSARTVDESEVRGPVAFTLDPRGNPTVHAVPELESGAAQFFTGATIAHGFFPRVPGRTLVPGESWTDTVAYAAAEAGSEMEVRTAWRFTAAGDSIVGGLPYWLVRAAGETEQSSTGRIGGTTFTQSVAGPVEGHFLWDPRAGGLHASEFRSDLRGSTEISIAPVPLEVRVRSAVKVERTDAR